MSASPPGALATAAKGLPGKEAVGGDTSVMPWLAGVVLESAGLLGELAAGTGLEVGAAAAGVAGMSYFCTCSR